MPFVKTLGFFYRRFHKNFKATFKKMISTRVFIKMQQKHFKTGTDEGFFKGFSKNLA